MSVREIQRGTDAVIGGDCPEDGRNWDVQCARCGSSLEFELCEECGGDGWIEDDDWQNYEGDVEPCNICAGLCSFPRCLSDWRKAGEDKTWCEAHPLPGREEIAASTPEWFVVPNDKKLPPFVVAGK